MLRHTQIFALLLGVLILTPISTAQHHTLNSETGVATLEDGTNIQWMKMHGSGPLAALKYVFTTTHVVIHCPGKKDFSVFTARTMPDVREAYARKDRAWCGWDHFIGHKPDTCIAPVSPRGDTYVAVAKPKTWLSADYTQCTMKRTEEFSMHRFLLAVFGTFLFWSAPALSESTPFRITGGALGIMMTSVVLLLFIVSRNVPHKKTFFMGSALFGSSLAGAARWAFGTWHPSARQVLTNPIILAYLVLSGLVGLAVTYYYNDTTNQRLNTILKVALQLVGLVTLSLSSTHTEGTVLLLAAALGAKVFETSASLKTKAISIEQEVRHAATDAVEAIKHQLSPASQKLRVTASALTSSLSRQQQHPQVEAATIPHWLAEPPAAGMTTPTTAGGGGVPRVSPLVERGMVLNEETGRTIAIGKSTYSRLLKEGYTVDMTAGTITPPPAGRSSGSGGGSGKKSRGRPSSSGGGGRQKEA